MTRDEEKPVKLPDIKEQYKKIAKKRYKRFGHYKVDKWIFQGAMWLTFAWLVFVGYSYHWNLNYYQCGYNPNNEIRSYDSNAVCKNPFYKPDRAWECMEHLPPGEYGTRLGPLFYSINYMWFIFFGVAFIINHFVNNKKKGA